MKDRAYIGLLLAAVLAAYGNTLSNGFTLDDPLYLGLNPQVTAPTLHQLFAPNKFSHLIRPVTFATFALEWKLGGAQPFVYHLFNLPLHAAVVCLLYLLLRKVLAASPQGNLVAFAAALLYAVHPIHTEAVASIVGRAELLAAGFLFAGCLLHLSDRPILAGLCFLLAVLSKESAVIFLPLVLVLDHAAGGLKSFSRYLPAAGLTVLYLAFFWRMQGGHFGIGLISRLDNPLASLPVWWRILNALRVGWKYVGLQIYPAHLSCDYSFNAIPVYLDLRHTIAPALATVGVVGAWAWAMWKRQTGLAAAGGIYLLGFATTANVLVPVGTIMGERLAYLPSAGLCILFALAWCWLLRRRASVAWAVLGIVVGVLGVRTALRNRDWRDNLSLYSSAVKAVPGSAKMHENLGAAYGDLGLFDLARREIETALRINPEYPDAMESYGLLEVRQGNFQRGGHFLENALYASRRDNPNYDFMAVNLAGVLLRTGHLDGAAELLDREIAESPAYARAWSMRAILHYTKGETPEARSDAEAALRLDPANPEARNLLHVLDRSTSSPPKN